MTAAAATFSEAQRAQFAAACAHVDADALRTLVAQMTAIPSPTGGERRLAEFVCAYLGAAGVEATYQAIDAEQGNAVARRRGDGTGPDLMLYAPIDAPFAGDEAGDAPWIEFDGRPDMRAETVIQDDFVIGLCAGNPKGHAACIAMTAIALARAGIPLRGDVVFGFGSGGMPVNRSPVRSITRANVGQGNGCSFMLEQGFRPDFAVIAKPGTAVAHEEVGLAWFKITVHGNLDYTGRGRPRSYKNPILDAMMVIAGLEAWFPTYTERNTSGAVAPKGNISAIEAGWPDKPAFSPAACNLYLDLRLSPRTPPLDAQRQLEDALAGIRSARPELDVSCEMMLAIPGTSTDPENWIVRSAIRAWELTNGRDHVMRTGTSGATDANILRGRGIPTARIGFPGLPPHAPHNDVFSMGVAYVPDMVQLTRSLIAVVLDTCSRTRADVGLR